MAKRPSIDTWLAARTRWEADPTETFESIAQFVGVSRVAVSKHADKESWQRPTSLAQISERAHIQADAKVTPKLSQVSGETSKRNAERAAIEVRAEVIHKHRQDWESHRELFTLKAIAADFEAGKSAKISAEMLTLRQRAERAAYGLDAPEQKPPESRDPHDLSDEELMASIRARRAILTAKQSSETQQ